MTAHEFLASATALLVLMGLASLIELAVPMSLQRPAGRARTRTNLGLTILTGCSRARPPWLHSRCRSRRPA